MNYNPAQHYLTHQFAETLSASQSRIVVVSSGAIRNVRGGDPSKFGSIFSVLSKANLSTMLTSY
jgi:hypothetical protein